MYEKEKPLTPTKESHFPQRRRTPSFSSSLLDAICRSLDESNGGCRPHVEEKQDDEEETMIRKQSKSVSRYKDFHEGNKKQELNIRQAIMSETQMENQVPRPCSAHWSSASSSSDSSNGGGGGGCFFSSSSETESSSKVYSITHFTTQQTIKSYSPENHQKKHSVGGFTRTKLGALKFYSELKKAKKQPIFPGSRISSFLNSIFSSGSAKKVKMCSNGSAKDVTLERKTKSDCSSVTSFSQSCLSKTPSRKKKSSHGAKRSVRFYPVSVIVDEDCRPCGHKCIYEDDPGLMPFPSRITRKSSMKEYQKKNIGELNYRGFKSYIKEKYDDSGDDDDESCSSSDLF